MSDTDSFIDEVNEEVKRDQLYGYFRKYGWIAVVLVLALVGGTIWNETRKSAQEASAQALGDSILAAMEIDDPEQRAAALSGVTAENPTAQVLLSLLQSSNQAAAGQGAEAAETLATLANNPDVPVIYRSIAAFRGLLTEPDVEKRRAGFADLATPGAPLSLLAEEQLALIDIETGDTDAAISRLKRITEDATVSNGLKERATQLMVALGAELETANG